MNKSTGIEKKYVLGLYRVFVVCVTLMAVAVVFRLFYRSFIAVCENYPREYRDGANIAIAKLFAIGINPYKINEGLPVIANCYGFINPLLAASITKIFGVNILRSFYILDFLYKLLFSFFVTYEVYSLKKGHIFNPLFTFIPIFAFTITCRSGHITTTPDTLGIMVGFAMLMLARRAISDNRKLILLILLSVVSFYIKAYFLFYVAPVVIFFAFVNWKKLLQYALGGIIIGVGSLFLINKIFPLYFINTIFFQFFANFTVGTSDAGARVDSFDYNQYSLNQFVVIFKDYAALFIAVIALIAYSIFISIKKRRTVLNTRDGLIGQQNLSYLIAVIMSIPVLWIMGKNTGNWCAYHLQLMMPAILVLGISFLIEITNNTPVRVVVITVLTSITLFIVYSKYGKPALLNEREEMEARVFTEKYIINHKSDECLIISPLANGILMNYTDEVSNCNGQDYWGSVPREEYILQKPLLQKVFPLFIKANEYSKGNNDVINFESDYKYIVVDDIMSVNDTPGYKEYEEYNIKWGRGQSVVKILEKIN